nr:ATP-binding cassette subfamily C1-6 [Brachionus rubens]
MENFSQVICGSSWESDTSYPDFSYCLEYTFFRWIPCFALILLTPFWVHMIKRKRTSVTKFSFLTFLKLALITIQILIEAAKIIISLSGGISNITLNEPVNYITPSILILAYLISIYIMLMEIKYGLRSSMLLFCFWGSLTLLSTFEFRSKIYEIKDGKKKLNDWDVILFYEYYSALVVILLLTLVSERTKNKDLLKEPKLYPEYTSPLLSRLTFWWLNPLILTGYKSDLTKEDMWDIDNSESCRYLTDKLEEEWNRVAKIYMDKKKLEFTNFGYSKSSESLYDKKAKDETEVKSSVKEPSLLWCLVKIFKGKFLAGAFLKLLQDILTMVGPTILDYLIKFVKNKNEIEVGLFYTGLLFLSSVIQTLLLQHYFHRMFIVGARVRTALMGLIYRKSLRLSSQSRKKATVGEMTNLMQVNTQSFVDLTAYCNILWSGPLQIIISIVLLWNYLQEAALAGVGAMILFIPLNAILSNKTKVLQTQKLKEQDSRIKLTNEILSGIKILKLYGWELSFQKLLDKIREKELAIFYKTGLYNVIIKFSFEISSFIVAIASFVIYIVVIGGELDASKAFVSLTLFNTMRFPLSMFPQVITMLIQANVSMTRIRTFLLRDEIDTDIINHNNIEGEAINVKDADLGWSDDEKTLHNLNFEVKKGELVAVVGSVGSGKSSLLSGLLGEMHKFKGEINVNGSTAYVTQQAWIQNTTLRNNILFGHEYNEPLYQKILSSCALVTDLDILPAGDQTEIGEKGINLSGGQKQRISIARSVYAKASIYTFDDPLSAVDAHVGKHIFDSVIGPKGLLKHKTRILATNSLAFLPECDKIIMLEKGCIKEIGTYMELIEKKSVFSNFLGEYIRNQQANKQEKSESVQDVESKSNKKSLDKKPDPEKPEKAGEKIIVKEKVESGQVKLNVLMDYFRSCTLWLSLIFILFNVLYNVFQSGLSLYLSDWTNNINSNNSDSIWNSNNVRLGVYSAIGIGQSIMMVVAEIFFVIMVMRSSRILHNSMLSSILRSNMQFFESTPLGRIINRFSKDIEAVENMIPMSYRILIRCLFQVIMTIIMISITTPWFLLPMIPIAIVYYFVQRYYVAAMRQLRRLNSVSKSPIFSHFGETLTGVSTIRAYNAEKRFINQMESKIDENLCYYYPDTVSNRWLAIRLEFIGTLVTFFACLFAVIDRENLTPGAAGLSISFSLNISQYLNWLVRMSADFESNITSVERIKEYCETPHEEPWIVENNRPPAQWPAEGHVEFNNYSVKYRDELDFVLREINCDIKPGEKIGIVGRTGAGKSSLTLALFRILESNYGGIKIDKIDIKKIGLHDLRKRLTIIPQEPVLFSGTLRINLDPFEESTDEQIWNALENAHLKEFVQSLEKKLDFECSEGGENLSVGQRQLICLARALLRKTKILILDEATASIDHNTDDVIQTTIRTQFKDCTVLTIAHRLNTIMDSTRIMVLDKGKIVEFDSPDNLLSNKTSLFYSLADSAGIVKNDLNDLNEKRF